MVALPSSFAAQGCPDCHPGPHASDRRSRGMPTTPSLTSCSPRVDRAGGQERTLRDHRLVAASHLVSPTSSRADQMHDRRGRRRQRTTGPDHHEHTFRPTRIPQPGRCASKVNKTSQAADRGMATKPTRDAQEISLENKRFCYYCAGPDPDPVSRAANTCYTGKRCREPREARLRTCPTFVWCCHSHVVLVAPRASGGWQTSISTTPSWGFPRSSTWRRAVTRRRDLRGMVRGTKRCRLRLVVEAGESWAIEVLHLHELGVGQVTPDVGVGGWSASIELPAPHGEGDDVGQPDRRPVDSRAAASVPSVPWSRPWVSRVADHAFLRVCWSPPLLGIR
jgi:hypothetical protein